MRIREAFGGNTAPVQAPGSPALSSSTVGVGGAGGSGAPGTSAVAGGVASIKRMSHSGLLAHPSGELGAPPAAGTAASVHGGAGAGDANNSVGGGSSSVPLIALGGGSSRALSRNSSSMQRSRPNSPAVPADPTEAGSALPLHMVIERRPASGPQLLYSAVGSGSAFGRPSIGTHEVHSQGALDGDFPSPTTADNSSVLPLRPRLSQPPEGASSYSSSLTHVQSNRNSLSGANTGLSGPLSGQPPSERQFARGSLSVLTANLLQQQVNSLYRQQSNLSTHSAASGAQPGSAFNVAQAAHPLQPQLSLRTRPATYEGGSSGFMLPTLQLPLHLVSAGQSVSHLTESDVLSSTPFNMGSPQGEHGSPASGNTGTLLQTGAQSGLLPLHVSHSHLYQPSPLHSSSGSLPGPTGVSIRPSSPGVSSFARRVSATPGSVAVPPQASASAAGSRRSSQQSLGAATSLRGSVSATAPGSVVTRVASEDAEGAASPQATLLLPLGAQGASRAMSPVASIATGSADGTSPPPPIP